jgi:DnaJ family protein C protein 11
LLNDQLLPAAVFYGTVVPVLSYGFVKKVVIDRYLESEERSEREKEKKQQENRLSDKKREALAVVNLWRETYNKIMHHETTNRGLVILTAFYGKSSLVNSTSQMLKSSLLDEEELKNKLSDPLTKVIDVKIALQCQVNDSKLSLPPLSKVSDVCCFEEMVRCSKS